MIESRARISSMGRLRIVAVVYQQVAAVFGAFGLAAIVGQVFRFEWRGIIAAAVAWWDSYVREPVGGALDWIVAAPLEWALGWNLPIPTLAKDYVAVGLVLGLSWARVLIRGKQVKFKSIFLFSILVLLWPPMLIWMIFIVLKEER